MLLLCLINLLMHLKNPINYGVSSKFRFIKSYKNNVQMLFEIVTFYK
jgi:hypothetical protein